METTNNLGPLQAIQFRTTEPTNTKIIWYDENVGQKIHKFFNTNTSSWEPIPGILGPTTFIDLLDTPGSFGTPLHLTRINAGGTALEFVNGNSLFVGLTGNQLIDGIKTFSNEVTSAVGFNILDSGFQARMIVQTLNANRVYTFPNKSGVVAMITDTTLEAVVANNFTTGSQRKILLNGLGSEFTLWFANENLGDGHNIIGEDGGDLFINPSTSGGLLVSGAFVDISTTGLGGIRLDAGNHSFEIFTGGAEFINVVGPPLIELIDGATNFGGTITSESITASDKTWTFPNKSGIVAMLSDTAGSSTLTQVLVSGKITGGNNIEVSNGDGINFLKVASNLSTLRMYAPEVNPQALYFENLDDVAGIDNLNMVVRSVNATADLGYRFRSNTGAGLSVGSTNDMTLSSIGLMTIQAASGNSLILDAGSNQQIVAQELLSAEFAGPIGFRIKAFTTGNDNINFSTGALDDISAGYDILIPDKAGVNQTMAFLSDLASVQKIKAGIVTGGSFAGNPKIFAVVFSTSFDDNNYAIDIVGEDSRAWSIQTKTAAGFTINSQSNTALAGNVFWSVEETGEFN